MIPVRGVNNTFAFMVRETDQTIEAICRDPMIYFIPGLIKYGDVRMLYFLIRVSYDLNNTNQRSFCTVGAI